MINIPNNENKQICSKCGGKCCKSYAGAYHPSDFGENLNIEYIEKLLTKRNDISIDCFENPSDGNKYGYFLRPRHVGGDIVDMSWGAPCIHLTETGCELPFDERPYGCRKLDPKNCSETNKEENYLWWKKYWKELDTLRETYDDGKFTGEIDIIKILSLLK